MEDDGMIDDAARCKFHKKKVFYYQDLYRVSMLLAVYMVEQEEKLERLYKQSCVRTDQAHQKIDNMLEELEHKNRELKIAYLRQGR